MVQEHEGEAAEQGTGGAARNCEAAESLFGHAAQPELCGALVEGTEQHEEQRGVEAERRGAAFWLARVLGSSHSDNESLHCFGGDKSLQCVIWARIKTQRAGFQ